MGSMDPIFQMRGYLSLHFPVLATIIDRLPWGCQLQPSLYSQSRWHFLLDVFPQISHDSCPHPSKANSFLVGGQQIFIMARIWQPKQASYPRDQERNVFKR